MSFAAMLRIKTCSVNFSKKVSFQNSFIYYIVMILIPNTVKVIVMLLGN